MGWCCCPGPEKVYYGITMESTPQRAGGLEGVGDLWTFAKCGWVDTNEGGDLATYKNVDIFWECETQTDPPEDASETWHRSVDTDWPTCTPTDDPEEEPDRVELTCEDPVYTYSGAYTDLQMVTNMRTSPNLPPPIAWPPAGVFFAGHNYGTDPANNDLPDPSSPYFNYSAHAHVARGGNTGGPSGNMYSSAQMNWVYVRVGLPGTANLPNKPLNLSLPIEVWSAQWDKDGELTGSGASHHYTSWMPLYSLAANQVYGSNQFEAGDLVSGWISLTTATVDSSNSATIMWTRCSLHLDQPNGPALLGDPAWQVAP